jgi:hypothetical protein
MSRLLSVISDYIFGNLWDVLYLNCVKYFLPNECNVLLCLQAKHNLDGRLYAIKKIKFKHSQPDVWVKVQHPFYIHIHILIRK